LAEAFGQLCPVALGAAREGVVEAMRALEHGARADESRAREIGRADPRLRGPARMKALGPCAFREVFDDSRGHGPGDAERIYESFLLEVQGSGDPRCRAHRP